MENFQNSDFTWMNFFLNFYRKFFLRDMVLLPVAVAWIVSASMSPFSGCCELAICGSNPTLSIYIWSLWNPLYICSGCVLYSKKMKIFAKIHAQNKAVFLE